MICENCQAELAGDSGLCSVCEAEATFGDVAAVESARPRYSGTGARLDKQEQDYHQEGQ